MKLAQAIEAAVDEILSGKPTALVQVGFDESDAWPLFGVCTQITADEVFSDTWQLIPLPDGFSADGQFEEARAWRDERMAGEARR